MTWNSEKWRNFQDFLTKQHKFQRQKRLMNYKIYKMEIQISVSNYIMQDQETIYKEPMQLYEHDF